MLTYNVPAETEPGIALASESEGKKKRQAKRYPRLCIPVSADIVAALKMDDSAEVVLRGKVVGLESRSGYPARYSNDGGEKNELYIELRAVSVDSAEADDEDEDDGEPKSMLDAMNRELDDPKKKAARAARKE